MHDDPASPRTWKKANPGLGVGPGLGTGLCENFQSDLVARSGVDTVRQFTLRCEETAFAAPMGGHRDGDHDEGNEPVTGP